MGYSNIFAVLFTLVLLLLIIIKAIREWLLDKDIIFEKACPTCHCEVLRIPRLPMHKNLGKWLRVRIKHFECPYCYKRIVYFGPFEETIQDTGQVIKQES